VWWVQYFNSMDQIILNTLEVADVPEVALVASDDFQDSIERLAEWLAVMREQ
jgi:hydrogenase-1 operon protein HyaF